MILYLARRYDESIAYLRKSLEIDADHFLLHFRLGLVYLQEGLQREAIDEMKCAVTLSGRSTETLTGLAQAYGMREAVDRAEPEARHRSPGSTRHRETRSWRSRGWSARTRNAIPISSKSARSLCSIAFERIRGLPISCAAWVGAADARDCTLILTPRPRK